MIERRATQNPADVTGLVAIIYTVGFMTLAGLLYFFEIPTSNKDALLYLFGILSGVELSIVAFYFGSNKNAEAVQRAVVQQQARTVEVLAQATPVGAVTPAPMNPATGNVPAAEVHPTGDTK